MDDLLDLIRKFESLFLPLLPRKWQNPPPSYRIIVPLLKKVGRYEKRFPWVEPLLYSIQTQIYPPYHEETLVSQGLTKQEMTWIRFILAGVALILLTAALISQASLISFWVKGGLFLASSILFIHGAMHISISALWGCWGFLFPLIAVLGIGSAPWAMVLLSSGCLLWHIPVLRVRGPWHWYDVLCTLPVLFFWVGKVSRMLPWPPWQSGLLLFALWFLLWLMLKRNGGNLLMLRTGQLFWPASLTLLTLVISMQPKGSGLFRFGLWIFGTLGLSLGMAKGTTLLSWSRLHDGKTVVGVFAIYALMLFIREPLSQLGEKMDTALLHLFHSIETLWWIAGAGIILSVRGLTLMLLKWIQAFLRRWGLFLATWIIPPLAYWMEWIPPLIHDGSVLGVLGIWIAYALGATFLAWKQKDVFLREWMFWGCFFLFLYRQYWTDVQQMVDLYWKKSVAGGMGFTTLAVWLLCLTYYTVGKYLSRFRQKERGVGLIAIMGAMLWLMVALLWMSDVDRTISTSLRGQIHYHLLKGFTLLGIPSILYHLIAGQYLNQSSPGKLPWPWILILGLGLTQGLQGVEHAVFSRLDHLPLEALQKMLLEALLSGTPLGDVMPAWVTRPDWTFLWRAVRWAAAIAGLSWMLRDRRPQEWGLAPSVLTFGFASLSVWTAEAVWLFWPQLPLEWAVLLRPWAETTLIWSLDSLKLYLLYLALGLLWGWLFFRFSVILQQPPGET